MTMKYAGRLTSSRRQPLPRIAKGHCDRQRPAVGKGERARALLKRSAGPEDAGGTNEVIAAVLAASHQARGAKPCPKA